MRMPTRARLVAPLAVAIAVAAASHAAAAPDPFRHDLAQVNRHLRIAVEYAPAELGESMRTAEIVCGLGERATSHGEADLAAADQATLGQVIDGAAVGQARRVEVAFRNADSVLADLRDRYEGRWAGTPEPLRELRRGVVATRRGIAIMRAAVAGLEVPFASWRADECEAATGGVEQAFTRAPLGLELINVGMLRLWRLTQPPPAATERR